MLLEAIPAEGSSFAGWTDGSTENPRMVSPKDGDEFIAKFKWRCLNNLFTDESSKIFVGVALVHK